MINCDNGVLFDPGIGNFFTRFSDYAYAIEYELDQIKSFHTKRSRYVAALPGLLELFYNNIAFYNGCLMWAFYISNSFEDEKKLLNNPFWGRNTEEYDFYDEIDFISGYFDKFERNSKYYFNKSSNIELKYKKIVETYKKFLQINNNFVSVKFAKEIKLPENIVAFDRQKREETLSLLNKAIECKDILIFLDFELVK